MKIKNLLADPAFEARIAAYDASEAFQIDANPDTAAALLDACAKSPDMAPKLSYYTRRASILLERVEAIGA